MDVSTHAVGENTRAIVFNHLKNSRFNLLYRFFGDASLVLLLNSYCIA